MIRLILILLTLIQISCQNDSQTKPTTQTSSSEEAVHTAQPTPIDFSQPTNTLTKSYLTNQIKPTDQVRLSEEIAVKPHSWLDSIYSYLDQANLSQSQSFEFCGLLTKLKFSSQVMQTHQNNEFSTDEFPLWYHQVISRFCRQIQNLDEKINRVESSNRSLSVRRKELQSELDSANLVSIGAELKRDEVAKGYWLLKGFLVNPGDSIYEISLPNLFEAQHLVCLSSTDCSAMKNLKAKIRGGFRDRVLLDSMTRYNSKGRIEMLVVYDRTENLSTNSGRRVEWIVVKEASHYPLLNAQRNYLQAEQAREDAQNALNRLESPVDLSTAYTAKKTALVALNKGMDIYKYGKEQLPRYIKDQDLYMKSQFYDLCDQLEWIGIGSLKSKLTKSEYRKTRKDFRKVLKGVRRIECQMKDNKRLTMSSFKGKLAMTTYKKNRKPKGSANSRLYHISYTVNFDDRGEMILSEFSPQPQGEKDVIVETAPALNRKAYAKRYKLHKPNLTLKKDHVVCNQGIEVFKRPRSKKSHLRLTSDHIVTKVDKVKRGWAKIHLFNQRSVYVPGEQICITQTRQDGNFRTLFQPTHELTKINVSEVPSKKGVTRDLINPVIFISNDRIGERKQWSQGWILEGKESGKRVYIKSEDMELINNQELKVKEL